MQPHDINVSQITSGSWLVDQSMARAPKRVFKKKDHAIAFARALAFSGGARMYIHGPDGTAMLQVKETVPFPLLLD